MRTIDDDADYPEGPLWLGDTLFYVEFAADRIVRRDGDRKSEVWRETKSGPCALGQWGGDLLLCAYNANALIRIDRDGRNVARWDRDGDGRPFIGPNDLVSDGANGFFFTASGRFDSAAPAEGSVLHIDASGTIRCLIDGLHYANGIAFDPTTRRLLVSEHLAARIVAFDVAIDGSLGDAQLVAHLPAVAPHRDATDPYAGGDGIELLPDGRLLVAHFGTGRLLILRSDGTLDRTIDLPLRYPTNVARHPTTGIVAVTCVADPWCAPFGGAVFHLEPDLLH